MLENIKKYDAAWLKERNEYFDGLKREIKAFRDAGMFDEKRIGIVGCWNNAGEVDSIMNELGLRISVIADNNPRKQNVSRRGIISQSVESLKEEKDLIILVLNNFSWKELKRQLDRMGLCDGKDYLILYGGGKFKGYALQAVKIFPDDFGWKKCVEHARKGYASYKKVYEKYKMPIWLMHQPSLGDLYLFACFLPHVYGKKCVQDCECVLVVTKNSCKKLAEIIGFKYIVMVTFEEAHKCWLTMMRLMGDKVHIHNAVFHGLPGAFQTMVHTSNISFRESFTRYVFQFPKEVPPIYPPFPKRNSVVKKIFEKYNLRIGKTVLISPYAGHFIADIDDNLWLYLVDNLKLKGYTVCTNCGAKEEKELPGTVAPFIELQDCVEFVELAGSFIGVRSGFCDLVCMAKCKKIVIYETGAPAGDSIFFGFNSMRVGENINEYINDCIHTKDMMDRIVSMF